jgi:hypothetical protein
MLRLSQKGDAVHIVLPDGTNAIIEALAGVNSVCTSPAK